MTQIPGNTVHHAGPRPTPDPDSAVAGLRPAPPEAWPAPLLSFYAGPGDLAVRKAWPSLEGLTDVEKAWPGPRPPAQALPLPALHACLTFASRSPAMQTAMRGSAAPQHQLREEGAVAGGGAGGGGAGGGAGAWKAGPGRRGAGKGALCFRAPTLYYRSRLTQCPRASSGMPRPLGQRPLVVTSSPCELCKDLSHLPTP